MIRKIVILVSLTLIFYGVSVTFEVTDTPASNREDGINIQNVWQERQKGDEISLSLFGDGFSSEMRVFLKDQGFVSSSGIPSWGLTLDMEISGDYLYIANNLKGFTIVDISDPTDPKIMTSMETGNRCWNIKVSGDYLYSLTPVNRKSGLESEIEIYDISNKHEPFLVNSLADKTFGTTFNVDKNTLYVAVGETIVLYDITDINDIHEIKTIEVAPRIVFIEIAESVLFIATRNDGVYRVDGLDSSILRISESVSALGLVYSQYLYLVGPNRQLLVYDSSGELLCSSTLPSDTYKVISNGAGGIYLSLLDFGIQEYQFDGAEIVEKKSFSASSIGKEFEVGGDYSYVANSGKSTIDIRVGNFEKITDVENYEYVGTLIVDFIEADNFGYVGSGSHNIKKINLESGKVETLTTSEKINRVYYDNGILFNYNKNGLHSGRDGFEGSVDPVDSINFKGIALDLVSYGSNLYLLDKNNGLRVVKYSQTGELTELYRVPIKERAYRISQFEEYLAISKVEGGIDFFSLADPDKPRKISSFKFPVPYDGFAAAWETSYYKGKLYVAAGYEGVLVLSIEDIYNPILTEIIPSKSFVKNVQILNGLLYFSEFNQGLTVYMLQESQPPVLVEAFHFPTIKKHRVLRSGEIVIMTKRGFKIVDPLHEITDFYVISENKMVMNIPASDVDKQVQILSSDVKSTVLSSELDSALAQN